MKQLELADDGRVIIRTDGGEWVLRRPTLGEYRRLVELAGAADEKLRVAVEATEDVNAQVQISAALQYGAEGQPALYGAVIRAYIEMLAEGEPPDIDDLPSWAVSSRAAARMIGHWRAVPLDLGPSDPGQ